MITATQERIALDRGDRPVGPVARREPATRSTSSSCSTPRRPPTSSGTTWPSGPCRPPTPAPSSSRALIVYRFEQRIDRLDVGDQEIPGALAGDPDTPSIQTNIIYSNLKTLWVEPATGIIVKAQRRTSPRCWRPSAASRFSPCSRRRPHLRRGHRRGTPTTGQRRQPPAPARHHHPGRGPVPRPGRAGGRPGPAPL